MENLYSSLLILPKTIKKPPCHCHLQKLQILSFSLAYCNTSSTAASLRAADCGQFMLLLGLLVWRDQNIPVNAAARQGAWDSTASASVQSLNPGAVHMRRPHPAAWQKGRDSCLMRLTARSLCPTTGVHSMHEIALSWSALSVCRQTHSGHVTLLWQSNITPSHFPLITPQAST